MTSERLRILLIGPYPEHPDKIDGGVEAAMSAISAALAVHPDVGRVVVASLFSGEPTAPLRLAVSERLEVRRIRVPFLTGDAFVRAQQCVLALRPLLAELRPHVAHGQGIDRQGDIAIQLGLPSVVTVHGLVHIEARMKADTLRQRLKAATFEQRARRVLGRANVTVSISDYDARALAGMVGGQRVNIPNAIADAFFAAYSPVPAHPGLLFAGVMRPRKNVLGLVNAFAQVRRAVPEATLTIAGPTPEPDYAAHVRARVADLGIAQAVTFLGHVSNEQLVAAMAQASVVSLFSHEETLPTVLAQALAVGRPVVASRVGGIPELVTHADNGYLVPVGDEESLAAALTALLQQPALRQAMGAAGHQRALQRFESSAVAEQTVQAYLLAMRAAAQARQPGSHALNA